MAGSRQPATYILGLRWKYRRSIGQFSKDLGLNGPAAMSEVELGRVRPPMGIEDKLIETLNLSEGEVKACRTGVLKDRIKFDHRKDTLIGSIIDTKHPRTINSLLKMIDRHEARSRNGLHPNRKVVTSSNGPKDFYSLASSALSRAMDTGFGQDDYVGHQNVDIGEERVLSEQFNFCVQVREVAARPELIKDLQADGIPVFDEGESEIDASEMSAPEFAVLKEHLGERFAHIEQGDFLEALKVMHDAIEDEERGQYLSAMYDQCAQGFGEAFFEGENIMNDAFGRVIDTTTGRRLEVFSAGIEVKVQEHGEDDLDDFDFGAGDFGL